MSPNSSDTVEFDDINNDGSLETSQMLRHFAGWSASFLRVNVTPYHRASDPTGLMHSPPPIASARLTRSNRTVMRKPTNSIKLFLGG